jgi:hypothetical protein
MAKWFEELSAVNVNEHIKQKNGLNYLSWMWAWQELKKRYPLSYATVHETEDGMLVWRDPIGGHVKTSVTLVWIEEDSEGNEVQKEHTATEYLPVMDFRNKAVPYENIDAMMVNKTIQRSLTKCIARMGLGSYIFVDEDLPEEEKKQEKKKQAEKSELDKVNLECFNLAKKKSATNNEKVTELCKKYVSNGNPKRITNIEDSKALLEELKALK